MTTPYMNILEYFSLIAKFAIQCKLSSNHKTLTVRLVQLQAVPQGHQLPVKDETGSKTLRQDVEEEELVMLRGSSKNETKLEIRRRAFGK